MDARYRELVGRVDAFVARVAARHPAELACRAGCDGCCRTRLTVTAVEAAAIEAWAAEQPAEARAAIAAAARAPVEPASVRCAALDGDGRCRIYPARPLVCRSHGIPIRLRDGRGLPVVTACELNFRAAGPGAADADCVLDQELVSTTLGLVDRAAHPGADRRDLAAVLVSLA
ncbi:MAG TPA: YkgJ family cysteine cluster protein [Kofleriaceae bacterium]|nr:YkgJ family cysteine cluster protein [Kofleriaceae bacterium]